ncbi:hypothetical protein V3H38_10950 [Vibrio parahaemolyticus]|uniref:hypothetical protein n=1 Tax=Vibrio parahaemolyticus TaxID=670 RepID=UPI002362BECC|nr:hypothetical protein [Vibrio parahaemolyticus]
MRNRQRPYTITVELAPEKMQELTQYSKETGIDYTTIVSDVIENLDYSIIETVGASNG